MPANSEEAIHPLLHNEWLVTNGLGGYASGTVCGALTRRYHGLLVASFNPPTDRRVLVSKTEETICLDDKEIELGCNLFGNVLTPRGFEHLEKFERAPLPTYYYQGDDFKLKKTLFMCHGQNTTVVMFENTGQNDLFLKSKLLLNHRDYHSNTFENDTLNFYTDTAQAGRLTTYAFYQAPPLHTYHNGTFIEQRNWHKNYYFPKEAERGLTASEDLFSIGFVSFNLRPGETGYLIFTAENNIQKFAPEKLKAAEIKRIKKLKSTDDAFMNDLLVSADQFLVQRKATESHTIIAGYHWFTDWGRDSMIALRGLAIDANKPRVVESIVNTFLQYKSQGMLPNRFPDSPSDEVEYNTIDATLWLFVVLYEYHKKFGSKSFIKKTFDALTDIINHYKKGTRYSIHETPEGFIYGGEGIAQLTWMDARIGDYVVTPRHGCPVEIQALWYNALKIYEQFADLLNQENDTLAGVKDSLNRFEKHFRNAFWNEAGYLNDVVLLWHSVDTSMRCNQIYAVSLPFSPLDKADQKRIVQSVEKALLTPYGLRTLATNHPDFQADYGGDVWKRDKAYHQGTVWPFLLSEFVEARLKTFKNTPKNRKGTLKLIEPLKHHFYNEGCLYSIAEIFDGLHPKSGKGAIQQAWSVAALIRILSLEAPFTQQKVE